MGKLTEKQLAFCSEYVTDYNATKAAIRAGYSVKSASETGSRLLANPDIVLQIEKSQAHRAIRVGITADRVLAELGAIAFSNIFNYVDLVESEELGQEILIRPLSGIPHEMQAAIKSIRKTKEGHITVELHDKNTAINSLCKILGLGGDIDIALSVIERYGCPIRYDRANDRWFILEDKDGK